ncbi:DUF1499 domain-containing protein [Jannaschia aquimarina]|uniref:DUF1499 domain-containing protein n=1 Tax=Jannaschia aquimarina TaxID=935700 RepID=A0A0D1CSV6_9RHOB|nr:DUF1499 domain-containing protein [Jannaschia aquimarina]KIT17832.1 hypothetical protein jaqu_04220 [Jannaschia aquimarina]SNS90483.1 Uncharacterized conserved protein, DUF1499 family [Jannaschia aquimarina]
MIMRTVKIVTQHTVQRKVIVPSNKRTVLALGAAAFAATAGAAWIRYSGMEAEDWHVDPESGSRTGRPNEFVVAEGGDMEPVMRAEAPAALLARLDEIALAEPNTERLAGSPEEGLVTYVQRSDLMQFPDAISVKAEAAGDGSRLTIWSRSRYGYSDAGVNRARVERWLEALEQQ